MAEFPSVTVDLSEQLEFPGDSYPLTGKVDVATYTVGEKEYQLQDGIDYDVVFTNAGTGVLLTGLVRAHATGECPLVLRHLRQRRLCCCGLHQRHRRHQP